MFGNFALNYCTFHFATSFQLQRGTMADPITLQCDPLSCILYTYSVRKLSVLYYKHVEDFRAEVSFPY